MTEQLDFIWLDCLVPNPQLQGLTFYTQGLGGRAERYRVDADRHLRLLGKISLPFEDWQERAAQVYQVCHYTGKLDVWTSVLVDGDHSQRFAYQLEFKDGWLVGLETI